MSIFVKKGMTLYGFGFLFIIVFSVLGIAADKRDPESTGATSVMYSPPQEKSQKLIAVELIRPQKYSKRYVDLRQAIQENGWQPIAKGTENGAADKCLIALSESGSGYVLECAIFHQDHTDLLQTETASTRFIIDTIKAFSKLKHHPSSLFKSKNKVWI